MFVIYKAANNIPKSKGVFTVRKLSITDVSLADIHQMNSSLPDHTGWSGARTEPFEELPAPPGILNEKKPGCLRNRA